MKLSTAMERYVHWKELRQIRFVRGKHVFRALLRRTGDMPLAKITPRQISTYLDGSKMAPDTWWRVYQMLRSFFQFWVARNQIRAVPMPRPRAALPPPFRPYIFSKSEVRQLLEDAGRVTQNPTRKCDPETVQSVILFLYSTGALIHEAIELRTSEIDLAEGLIMLRRRGGEYRRKLPIGKTIAKRLGEYIASTSPRRRGSEFVFLSIDGKKLRRASLLRYFQKLCLRSNIRQEHGISVTPGMHDLRHTFAVHCLNAWLAQGKDARQMLPVLSAYMGHVMLRSTEQYLRLVPDRFKKQLKRLASNPVRADFASQRTCKQSLLRPS